MPQMSGTEFLRGPGSPPDAIRIILTGYTDVDALVKAVNRPDLPLHPSRGKPRSCASRPACHRARTRSPENARLVEELRRANERLRRDGVARERRPRSTAIGAGSASKRLSSSSEKVRTPTPPCCSPARPAPARTSSRARSTTAAPRARAALRRAELRRAARHAARERAVRPRARRLHGRARGQEGPVRGRATAARSSSTRSARRSPACRCGCCACSRTARSGRSARPTTRKVDVRIVAATNRDLRKGGERAAASARTSTTGCAWSRSRCRRCASGARTSRRSRTTSSTARPQEGRRLPASRTPRWTARARTRGAATCASSRTRSSAPSRSPTPAGPMALRAHPRAVLDATARERSARGRSTSRSTRSSAA